MCDDEAADRKTVRMGWKLKAARFFDFFNHLWGKNRLLGEIEYLQTPVSTHSGLD